MSITVSDLLKLPSLRQAEVVGGHRGLNKIVSSISVLEGTDTNQLVDGIFGQGEFFGSEIVITGFLNCLDDIECQCANIRRLAEGGEVGLIIFYAGIYLKEIDRKLIDTANELDFVLIKMPPLKTLRYGEVISDVNEFIFNDRAEEESIVSDILARVSRLTEHQRSVDTVLRMLSDRVMSSVVLTDSAMHVLNLAPWPQSMRDTLNSNIAHLKEYAEVEGESICSFIPDGHIYHFEIYPDGSDKMHIFVIKEGMQLHRRIKEQIADVVRICINIWGREHGTIVLRELIRAIIQDDPIKMRRLSDIFKIDIASIHELWILRGKSDESTALLRNRADSICECLKECADVVFADIYEDELLLFSSTPYSELQAEKAAKEIIRETEAIGEDMTVSRCGSLENTTDVRNAYMKHRQYISDAAKIYPARKWFSIGDIEFAASCHQLADRGEESLDAAFNCLRKLQSGNYEWDVPETLAIYLLDTDSSVTRTAEIMFLHKNTIKYRLRVISDELGFRPNKMPDSIPLYQALAVSRLLK